jgi:archaeosortase A (PGF-CTERM-specific)
MYTHEILLVAISVFFMLLYVFSKREIAGFTGWLFFALLCAVKVPEYIAGEDYYNTGVFALASAFFAVLAYSILRNNSQVFLDVTSFSALACLIYFPFAIDATLNAWIIDTTAILTAKLGNLLGYSMIAEGKMVYLEKHAVEIILPCTAIESISLFAGATLGIRAAINRKIAAFLISVPVIYILNLIRNIFVILSFTYSWFGDNSFYIAHHIIAKIFSTLALILIAYAVFRFLPELAELIYSLKDEIEKGVRS